MNKDFVFEFEGGENVVKNVVVQLLWEFLSYIVDENGYGIEWKVNIIDQKIL